MKAQSEVLARKYRPNSFNEVIGQESISQTLALSLDSNRIAHAYLFSGLRGSGKTSTARIFAKALVCDNGPSSTPCGTCNSCEMANAGRHMDIIEMDAASSRKIDDIRDLIEHTKYKPSSARYKVFIIDEVHMLTKEAFNALLKTLEEPPEYIKFILATTDPLKLPATILSRTQHFRFKRISQQNIVNHLIHILNLEGVEFQHEAIEILARSGSGSLRDTLTLLDQAIIYSKNFVDVKTVTDMLGLVDPEFINAIFRSVFAKDSAQIIEHVKSLEDYEPVMIVDELIAYLKEKLYSQDPHFSTLVLERFFRILSEAKSLFSINADGGFVLSLIFFKMVEALRIKEVDLLIEEFESQMQRPKSVSLETTTAEKPTPTPVAELNIPSEIIEDVAPPSMEKNESIELTLEVPIQAPKIETPQAEEEHEPSVEEMMFNELVESIYDRSDKLGECFKSQIRFISYENETLTWESCANEECKAQLRHTYGVIKQFVKEIFGFETKIKHLPCSKPIEETPSEPEPQIEATQAPQSMPYGDQTASTTADMEMGEAGGSASCVTGCSDENPKKDYDGGSILEEPLIKKATELFEATKITVQSKI